MWTVMRVLCSLISIIILAAYFGDIIYENHKIKQENERKRQAERHKIDVDQEVPHNQSIMLQAMCNALANNRQTELLQMKLDTLQSMCNTTPDYNRIAKEMCNAWKDNKTVFYADNQAYVQSPNGEMVPIYSGGTGVLYDSKKIRKENTPYNERVEYKPGP